MLFVGQAQGYHTYVFKWVNLPKQLKIDINHLDMVSALKVYNPSRFSTLLEVRADLLSFITAGPPLATYRPPVVYNEMYRG